MKWLAAPAPEAVVSTALLLIRLAMGTAFILHGLPKLENPTGWMDGLARPAPRWDVWLALNVGLLTLLVGIPLVNAAFILTGGGLVFAAVGLLLIGWRLRSGA